MQTFGDFTKTHVPSPAVLYHGTETGTSFLIDRENVFKASNPSDHRLVVYGKYRGVYLTEDLDLAKQYADDGTGVVYKLDGHKLAEDYTLLRLGDRVFVVTSNIENAKKYILRTIKL